MPDHVVKRKSRRVMVCPTSQLFLLVATAAIVVVFMWSVNRKRPVQIAARPEVQTAPATATGPAAPTSPLQRGEARR